MGDNSHASAVWAILGLIICFASPAFSQSGVPGTIEGNADVTLSGSATYTIPIKVPPGTAGTSPKIAIVYSSQGPSGVLGAGWTIAGLSKITRGLKTIRTDGVIQGPHFDNTDALYLDGQRLHTKLKVVLGRRGDVVEQALLRARLAFLNQQEGQNARDCICTRN